MVAIFEFMLVSLFLALMLALGVAIFNLVMLVFKEVPKTKKQRNYVVRFNPINEKYYITNHYNDSDHDVKNSFGFRKYYSDAEKATIVTILLNSDKGI